MLDYVLRNPKVCLRFAQEPSPWHGTVSSACKANGPERFDQEDIPFNKYSC
jgi:hypothetical protein